MSKSLLPFSEPLVRTFLDYAYMFGMREGNSDLDRYLMCHYGNVCFVDPDENGVFDPFDLYPAPRLRQFAQSRVVLSKGHDLWREDESGVEAFFREQIKAGRYCLTTLDEFFLPGKNSFQKHHFIHHHFVIGWDEEKELVALVGYFRLANSDFGVSWVSIRDFVRAFAFDSERLPDDQGQEIFAITSFKYSVVYEPQPNFCYHVLPEPAIATLKGYLNSSGDLQQMLAHNKDLTRFHTRYGISACDSLAEYIRGEPAYPRPLPDHTMHALRLFSEHKSLMLEKFDFWVREGFLPAEETVRRSLVEIRDRSRGLRLIAFELLRGNGNRETTIRVLTSGLKKCCDLETTCYPRILGALGSS